MQRREGGFFSEIAFGESLLDCTTALCREGKRVKRVVKARMSRSSNTRVLQIGTRSKTESHYGTLRSNTQAGLTGGVKRRSDHVFDPGSRGLKQ